jgi:hypothetical protein
MILRLALDDTTYEIDLRTILNVEAIEVQKRTGYAYDDWLTKCDEGDPQAITAMVWLMRKRAGQVERFSEVEFPIFAWRDRELVSDEPADPPTTPAEAGQTENN